MQIERTVKYTLKPFPVPSGVHYLDTGINDADFLTLKEFSKEELEQLCEEFNRGVLNAAGYSSAPNCESIPCAFPTYPPNGGAVAIAASLTSGFISAPQPAGSVEVELFKSAYDRYIGGAAMQNNPDSIAHQHQFTDPRKHGMWYAWCMARGLV